MVSWNPCPSAPLLSHESALDFLRLWSPEPSAEPALPPRQRSLHPSCSAFLSACPWNHIATEPLSQVRSLPEPLQEPSSCRQLCLSPLRVSPGLGHWQERNCSRQQRWVHDAADEESLTQLMKGPTSRDSSTGHGNHQAMTSPSHQERKIWETPTCPTWKPWMMFSACPNRTFQQGHSTVKCSAPSTVWPCPSSALIRLF